MGMNLTEQVVGYLTIQHVSRRTGLSESALRYYEGIGLIDKVPRDGIVKLFENACGSVDVSGLCGGT
jgi:hypothetical protein